jgi:DNA topoisomerase I
MQTTVRRKPHKAQTALQKKKIERLSRELADRLRPPKPVLHKDPRKAAKAAGLEYLMDNEPGITRSCTDPKSCSYLTPAGNAVSDEETLKRIKRLAIPPAWTDVWISPIANGHLQATGRDAKGRKQYRYHHDWRSTRDETKYGRMMAFGKALPKIRQQVEADLALPGLPRRKVLATVVRLLETTFIRVGNEEYARTNNSFGLTTMQDQHVAVKGCVVNFKFVGKRSIYHEISLEDCRLAQIVKECRDVPGAELFQYIDENGKSQTIKSGDVNAYLREISGKDFTAKDFRTWGGTVLAAMALQEMQNVEKKSQVKKNVKQAIETVSQRLGNTPAICKKCYIHPAIIDSYLDGTLLNALRRRINKAADKDMSSLRPEEAKVLTLLRRRLNAAN